MPVIIGVKFKFTNKIYYFDPKDIQLKENDGVIVETARGIEYGKVMVANKEVDEKE
ncbi:MAG: stage 0 sporulation protein, partial [Christensenellales bacterium]